MTIIQRISLLTSVLVGLTQLPAYAQTTQNAEQSATVSGNNNQVYQVINQTIINRPGRGWNRNDRNNKPDKNRPDHPRNNRDHDDDDNGDDDDDD